MDFRHEWKHEINQTDLLILRQRLRAVASPDPHAVDGRYTIRSLYFDNAADKVLHEKLDGVNRREKFRIRYYNGDTSVIHLEKKSRVGGLGNKQSAALTAEQAQAIADGILDWMPNSPEELIRELYIKMRTQGLRPKTIVDYTREPFIFSPGNVTDIAPGNVRVTLDYNIRTGSRCRDFLDPSCITVPVVGAPIILEVKWDNFLPDIIRDAVRLPGRRVTAFSKYAQCRIYG
ncbi:MAG: polyphosphate polymerase domain-containing protein [Lachnospiraceae bacterium]|nr:polyphosphate polymerase domain-containing protein [Lachnospiraceae bacterium]